MSDHSNTSNHNRGFDIKHIVRSNPITSLALVAVFGIIVGSSAILQTTSVFNSQSEAAIVSTGPQCPPGTTALFILSANKGSLNTTNISLPGTIITSASSNWKMNTRKGGVVVENGSGTKTLNLSFPYPIKFEKVLVYDNDHNPSWTLNGQSLPATSNDTWYPVPYDLANKGPFSTLEFNSNGDSPHFNVCIPFIPPSIVASPTPPVIPSVSPSQPPITSISPTPSGIACNSMEGQIKTDKNGNKMLALTVKPNIAAPGYFVKIMKDNQIVHQSVMQSYPIYSVNIETPSIGKYIGYVSRSSLLGFVSSAQCEYTNTVAVPTTTPTPTKTQAVAPQCLSANPTEPIPYNGGTVNVSVNALNSNYVRFLEVGRNGTFITLGTYPYTGTTSNNYRISLKRAQTYQVDTLRYENGTWITGTYCRFEGVPSATSPTGEPMPSSSQ